MCHQRQVRKDKKYGRTFQVRSILRHSERRRLNEHSCLLLPHVMYIFYDTKNILFKPHGETQETEVSTFHTILFHLSLGQICIFQHHQNLITLLQSLLKLLLLQALDVTSILTAWCNYFTSMSHKKMEVWCWQKNRV